MSVEHLKLLKTSTALLMMLLMASCVPDSLTKWEEDPAPKANSGGVTITDANGSPVTVAAPNGGSAPSSISYGATSFGFKVGDSVSQTVTVTGGSGTGSGSFVYTSVDPVTSASKPISQVPGLSLNSSTGAITGTASAFYNGAGDNQFKIQGYHIPSGTTLSTTITITASTDLDDIDVFYPQTANTTRLILTLDDVSDFSEGGSCASNNSSTCTVNYVDSINKQIFITVLNPGNQGFAVNDELDNASSFVIKEAKITKVVYAFATEGTSAFSPMLPCFDNCSSSTIGAAEGSGLTWSITPDTAGDLEDTDQNCDSTDGICFQDSDDGLTVASNGQFFSQTTTTDVLSTTEYTVTVRNEINQTKQVKINLNVSNSPQLLSYTDRAIVTLDTNSYFTVGDPISSNSGGIGKVLRKFSTDKLLVRIKSGTFKSADLVDKVETFLTQRAAISSVEPINAIFHVSDASGFTVGSGAGVGGISTAAAASVGVVVAIETGASGNTKSIPLVNAIDSVKWSPGDMVVGRTTGTATNTGVGNVLRVQNGALIVNVISGTFAANNCLQNRSSYYDSDSVACSGEQDALANGAPSNVEVLYVRVTPGTGTQNFSTGTANLFPSFDGTGTAVDLNSIEAESLIVGTANANSTAAGQDISFAPSGLSDSANTAITINASSITQAAHGFAAAVQRTGLTVTLGGAIQYVTPHGLTDGTPVMFSSVGGALGINTTTVYYVKDSGSSTEHQLSTTLGGAAVTITLAGAGAALYALNRPFQFGSTASIPGLFTNKVYYLRDITTNTYALSSAPGGTAASFTGGGATGSGRTGAQFASAFGIVDKVVDATTLNVNVENGYIGVGDGWDNHNPHDSLLIDTVTSVSERRKFNFFRGEKVRIAPSMLKGDSVIYRLITTGSLADTLPEGLSLDSTTGVVSGTPTKMSAEANYKIEGVNAVGSQEYSFSIQVHDTFEIFNVTSNAFSFKLHKGGQGRQSTPCRITSSQLETTSYLDSKNIVCYLEAGELDLYSSGLKLKGSVGPGMCNFLSMRPYQFSNHQIRVSGAGTTRYKYNVTIPNTCLNNAATCLHPITMVALDCDTLKADLTAQNKIACESDYTTIFGSTYPNCDDGNFRLVTASYTDTGPDNNCNLATEVTVTIGSITSCGGSKSKCVDGPAKTMFSDAQIDLGINSEIYATGSGMGSGLGVDFKTWDFSSPIAKGYVTNKFLANFNNLNYCASGEFDYNHNAWQEHAQGYYYRVIVDDFTDCDIGDTITFGGGVTGLVENIIDAADDFDDDTNSDKEDVVIFRRTNPSSTSSTFTGTVTCTGGAPKAVIGSAHLDYSNPYRRRQPYYDLDCLNASYDTIARIRLVVRDWNRDFNWTSRIDRVSPDRNLFSPAFMDVNTIDDFGNNYNNRSDWDDALSATKGVYNVNSCGGTITSPTPPIPSANDGAESFPGLGI